MVDIDQILDWQAYFELKPFGEERADLRSGIVACTIANAHAVRGRRFTVKDFMPKLGTTAPRRVMSGSEIAAVMDTAAARIAGMRRNGKK